MKLRENTYSFSYVCMFETIKMQSMNDKLNNNNNINNTKCKKYS